MSNSFAQEVEEGLSLPAKKLSSKYFYDDIGSRIFQEIMAMPEYYPTKCELRIFQAHSADIVAVTNKENLNIIELGAGDASKTYYLLKAWLESGNDFVYSPLDISQEALDQAKNSLAQRLPQLKVSPIKGEYFQVLERLSNDTSTVNKLVLFLGSNLGNFPYQGAFKFLKQLYEALKPGDQLLIGIDLKKAPSIILPAYSDAGGITARFNLNLLERINKELDGDFKLKNFKHYASYEPETGEVRSYLISQKEQDVHIGAVNKSFHFAEMESIHTEISKKYGQEEFKQLIKEVGFAWKEAYYDSNLYFMDVLMEK